MQQEQSSSSSARGAVGAVGAARRPGVGELGFVVLVSPRGSRQEAECFVLLDEGKHSICIVTETFDDDASWTKESVASSSPDQGNPGLEQQARKLSLVSPSVQLEKAKLDKYRPAAPCPCPTPRLHL